MARRLSSPIFVGRSRELQELLSAADSAASGQPALILVGGEAGVGKSRLVEEAVARLRADDWLVVEGGAVALGEDGLPFGPIVEALRSLARQVDPDVIAEAAGPSLPELARLVPEVAMVGDVAPAASQTEWLQTRIFEGALRLLGRLGETTPVLLVIEDLHWADRSTRDLLAFLTRNARAERLMLIATFRSDELHRRHPLTAWLAETERLAQVERIDLDRFGRDELVELLTGIAGAPPTAALVDSIARRSDGNAFFAEELAAAADAPRSSRERLPETLRGVLQVRLAAGSEDAGRLVEIAAVAGRQVEHELLAEGLRLVRCRHGAGVAKRDRRPAPVRRSGRVGALPVPTCARAGGRLRRSPAVRAPDPARSLCPGDRSESTRQRGRGRHPARRDRPSLAGGAGFGSRPHCRDRGG